jgi:hypothetical protein
MIAQFVQPGFGVGSTLYLPGRFITNSRSNGQVLYAVLIGLVSSSRECETQCLNRQSPWARGYNDLLFCVHLTEYSGCRQANLCVPLSL